jgi:hypothetical protein
MIKEIPVSDITIQILLLMNAYSRTNTMAKQRVNN